MTRDVKDELGRESLDYGASRAFAIADQRVARVHVTDQRTSPAATRQS